MDLANASDAVDRAARTASTPRRYDLKAGQVRVVGAREATTVLIPWASRQALLRRLGEYNDTNEITHAFDKAGSSGPVRLTRAQRTLLLLICTDWLEERAEILPEGLYALRNALLADQHQPARAHGGARRGRRALESVTWHQPERLSTVTGGVPREGWRLVSAR